MRFYSTAFVLCLSLWLGHLTGVSAHAEEAITQFNVQIDVQKNGDILVTEDIQIRDFENQFRRGIVRELPRKYEKDGEILPYRIDMKSIRREGNKEPYDLNIGEYALNYRIGDADVYLPNGLHNYRIQYSVKNQVRYFDDKDEIYWNATGTYWPYPIENAKITINFPNGANPVAESAYTGAKGADEQNYRANQTARGYTFETTQALGNREGITVSAAISKGIIDPPSKADNRFLWWLRNGALTILSLSLAGITGFYTWAWRRVGRDPIKGPVFARYEPPKGYSPAAVSHVYFRGFKSHKALIATLMNMGVKGVIDMTSTKKKVTEITRTPLEDGQVTHNYGDATATEIQFLADIFKNRKTVNLGKKSDTKFTKAYTSFRDTVSKEYGKTYHKGNAGYIILGFVMTIFGIILALAQFGPLKPNYFLFLLALVLMNCVMFYLMPAPTKKGQKVRTEIEGFKLYLETAEKLQLNAVEVGDDKLPFMTTKRYERFLPYAIALGVEEPWTQHFEHILPEEAKAYNPGFATLHTGNLGNLSDFNSSLVSNLSSGVSASMPQSSSSSGSSGGGFSGGGGGGGGGGSW